MRHMEISLGLFFGRLREGDVVSDFDCGNGDTNDFLKNDAIDYQRQNLAASYVLKDASNKVLGFVSLAMGAIRTKDHPALVVPNVEIRQYPGLKIGQLGVTRKRQGEKLGEFLVLASIKMAEELKENIGCRFVLVDAYHERIGFYERLGFKQAKSKPTGGTMPMYLLISEG